MKFLVSVVLLGLVLTGGLRLASRVTVAHGQEPTVTFMFPQDRDVLVEPPTVLQMCFANPIDVRDLDKGGDFAFRLTGPNEVGFGMRVVFQPDGYGVAVYPGPPGDAREGKWKFEWRVRDAVTLKSLEDTVNYDVQPDGKPVMTPPPPQCGGTKTPEPPVSPEASPDTTSAPSDSQTPGLSSTPTPELGDANSIEDGDDDPDLLQIALLASGALGAAILAGVGAYLLKSRMGSGRRRRP